MASYPAAHDLGTGSPGPRLLGATEQDEVGAADVPGRTRMAAAWLGDAGVQAGDRVMLKADNSVEYVIALLALAEQDTSIVLLDHRSSPRQSREVALAAQVSWFVSDDQDDAGLPGDRVLRLPAFTRQRGPLVGTGQSRGGPDAWWHRQDAVVLWSSGTTGPAKGVVKSGRSLWQNTIATQQGTGIGPCDVLAPWLPFSHQYGLSVVLLWWLVGCTLSVVPYQRIDRAADQTVRDRATVVDGAPSTYYTLLRLIGRRPWLREQLSRVRMWGVGGAPLPGPLAAEFRDVMGTPLLDGYGMTEVGNVALASMDSTTGCGGPLPGVAVRIVDAAGEPAPVGSLGEIVVRSDGLMTGYLDGSLPVDDNLWYRTNDIGYQDSAGNLHVVGRKHAVHRLGHTLYPDSIARRAEQICGREVRVLTTDDARRGTSLHFVICDADGKPVQYWRDLLCAELPSVEHPNRVHVVTAFPLTPSGKPDLAQLRALITPTFSGRS